MINNKLKINIISVKDSAPNASIVPPNIAGIAHSPMEDTPTVHIDGELQIHKTEYGEKNEWTDL